MFPHQQALVDRFFDDPTVRGHVARWDVGLGSVWTMALLIKRFVTANPAGRILVLDARKFTAQIHYNLTTAGLDADLVDRFRFRTMEDTVSSSEPIWREGGIYVLGTDFAKQDDIANSLCAVEWDFLILPDAHQIRGQKELLVKRLVEKSTKIRVLMLTVPGGGDLPQFGIECWNDSTVRQNEVVDAAGRRIFDFPNPVLNVIEIPSDPSERRLRDAVAELVLLLRSGDEPQRILGMVVESSIQSSLPALEEVLRRTRNPLAHGRVAIFQPHDDLDDETDVDNVQSLNPTDNLALLGALQKCLTEVESISADSKMEELKRLLEEVQETGVFPRSTCIVTRYLSTLTYVHTALDELRFVTFALKGSMDFDERLEVLEESRMNDAILISTAAAMEGIGMPEVKTLIMYDLPQSPLAMRQILGRFQRFGRSLPLTIYVFSDQKGIDVLREIILDTSGGTTAGGVTTTE